MGNLFSILHNVADSMGTFQKALAITGNNVTNANTPGYVRQRLQIVARPMEIASGLAGGAMATNLISSRRAYLERGVYQESNQEGRHAQMAFSIGGIEPAFDISQSGGVAGALDGLFSAFSQLSINPNDIPAREGVIRAAGSLAGAFNVTTKALGDSLRDSEIEIRTVVGAINRLGEKVQGLNKEIRMDASRLNDPGLDAQMHAALEELSEYGEFTVLRGADGAFNLYMGGQTPLVIGDRLYKLETDLSNSGAEIQDFDGKNITAQFKQGRIRALLDFRGAFVPSLMADLNRLAEAVADGVNGQLAAGVDLAGQAPTADLFTYDATAGSAATLRVTGITADQIAAAAPGAPGGNGNALLFGALGESEQIDDLSYTEFFGQVASRVGRGLRSARDDQETHSLLLSQARSIRAEISYVNLDQEAADLITFQRGYEASAQLVKVLNELTGTVLDLL